MTAITIGPRNLTLTQMRATWRGPVRVELSPELEAGLQASVDRVNQVVADQAVVYGINTGFGLLADRHIGREDLRLLQRSLVLSHAAGLGRPVDEALTRLIMLLKVRGLARGFSGVRPEVIRLLIEMINHELYPEIPEKGSVGASGDLAPLAHLALVLIGEGRARYRGRTLNGGEALQAAGLRPLELAPKEGLGLLNGTQVSTAFALRGLFEAEELFAAALGCGCLSLEAASGSRTPFDARIHEARGQKGQIDAAFCYRHLLTERSEISVDHANCGKVQDPYSLRCQPQVLGACLQQLRAAAEVLEIEGNAASDNPLIFAGEDGEAQAPFGGPEPRPGHGAIISGGNFHAEPVAMAADNLALALSEMAALSERRIALLMDAHLSKLPPFLVSQAGVNSGFMIAQVTAAALASQNKTLAFPSCVDSLPTSANQEDLVSMAANAGHRLWEMAENLNHILAIEWLAAVQGLDYKRGLKSSPALERLRAVLRSRVSHLEQDRVFSPDIEAAAELIRAGHFRRALPAGLLPSDPRPGHPV